MVKLNKLEELMGENGEGYENFAYICAKFVYGCTLMGQDILGT